MFNTLNIFAINLFNLLNVLRHSTLFNPIFAQYTEHFQHSFVQYT